MHSHDGNCAKDRPDQPRNVRAPCPKTGSGKNNYKDKQTKEKYDRHLLRAFRNIDRSEMYRRKNKAYEKN